MKMRRFKTLSALLFLLTLPLGIWAQEMSEKYSLTTQMFLNELKEQAKEQAKGPRRAPELSPEETQERLIASPDTIGGIPYISCFIHLNDVADLGEVQALGVRVEETFDRLNFVTAQVPVAQIESLAAIDNVTRIKVAQLMTPFTDVAKQKTNVDDLLTLSSDATLAGINSMFDGTGIVLGIIDTGIDFQHIAFKDKDGNCRIKRAYVWDGSSVYDEEVTSVAPTTDDATGDHGTHTSSTAGGSSVIVDGSTVTVTDNHAAATYGGMAPGADLYLAGIKGLADTYLSNALMKIVEYADAQGKPLVVSNSWGSHFGPRDGSDEWTELVDSYFGDSHPNHVILFSTANNAGRGGDIGGYFVKKNSASSASPLGTIIRSTGDNEGNKYTSLLANAWATVELNCTLYVLDDSTGAILRSWTVTSTTSSFEGLEDYYTGTLKVYVDQEYGKHYVYVYSNNLTTTSEDAYTTLAIEVYPTSGTTDIDMWSGSSNYYTGHLTTEDHTWTAGTDDMCVCNQTALANVISVGAYMSKTHWKNYENKGYRYVVSNEEDDIASFSSYATAELSPTGEAYPCITAPGAMVTAGVNHFHATGSSSYFSENYVSRLIVNNTNNPYGVMQGTSMATPVAAGIVALWMQAAQSVGKDLTVNEVKDIMAATAIKDSYVTTGTNASHFGNGKIDALAGIEYILSHYGKLNLANNGSNSEAISTAAESGKKYEVTLSGRTLYKDGDWNTLCLPFAVSNLSGTPLQGATVKTLTSSSFDSETGELTLDFTEDEDNLTAIEAGKPYIVKWTKAEDYDADNSKYDISNPIFEDVTIIGTANNITTSCVDFVGCTSPVQLPVGSTNLYLGSGNSLYYPATSKSIGSCRAYFTLHLNSSTPVKQFVMSFGEDDADGIEALPQVGSGEGASWYDLNGRRLSGKPSQKGIYIYNGRKEVLK